MSERRDCKYSVFTDTRSANSAFMNSVYDAHLFSCLHVPAAFWSCNRFFILLGHRRFVSAQLIQWVLHEALIFAGATTFSDIVFPRPDSESLPSFYSLRPHSDLVRLRALSSAFERRSRMDTHVGGFATRRNGTCRTLQGGPAELSFPVTSPVSV